MAQAMPDASTWLVATKLHPPQARDDTIRRPHLEEALGRSVRTLPLTLLSAPAGYGKTTLLASLPRLVPEHPLVWITLDPEDNDPVRFVALLATALGRLNPECGRAVWPWLAGGASAGSDLKRAVATLIRDVLEHLPDPFILVLDDLHFVTAPGAYVALEYLLEHQPLQLHLAVGTRYDPPLRLARLAARRQLGELRRPDLGFSLEEAHSLLNQTLGLGLAQEEVTTLQRRTEGWPAGLCLMAGPLGRTRATADRVRFMEALSDMERHALEFLSEEVLRDLPKELRRFLLQTSVLPEMTPSICQAVTGRNDAAQLLEQLYYHNLAVAAITPEGEDEPVYRPHALFARLLARHLEREMPGEIAELHRRAAEVQKTPGQAIYHYVAAGLWEPAARRMVASGMELLHQGMFETLRRWYEALPPGIRAQHPRLGVLMGRSEIHRGEYGAADVVLRQAREAFVASGDPAGEGEALTSLITLAYESDDRETTAAYVERALQLPLSPIGQVATGLARAWLHFGLGEWEASRDCLCNALAVPRTTGNRQADLTGITYLSAPLASVPGCLEPVERYCAEVSELSPPRSAWGLAAKEMLAWPLLWRGRVDEALARAQAAEALRQSLGGYPFVGNEAPVVLSVLHLARGELDRATEAVDALVQRMGGAGRSKWMFHLHAAGRALAILGRLGEAREMCRQLVSLPNALPLTRYLRGHLAGLIALLEGRHPEAAAALGEAATLEASLPVAWIGGSARLLQARLLLDQGRPLDALATAGPALEAWDGAGTPGCVLLDGTVGLPVLRAAAQAGDSFAAHLLALFPWPAADEGPTPPSEQEAGRVGSLPGAGNASVLDPLTPRERDVLHLLVAGRTNRQIAEELFVTQETVKSHVMHILRKLDVTSRTQAALKGRELGL